MPIPAFSGEDYLAGLQGLLPQGSAWPREADAVWTGLLAAFAPTYERSGAAAAALVPDLFPAATVSFLPEWEETLGLPDECSGPEPTLQGRRQAVVSKLAARGGQSVPYYLGVAASLGAGIAVQEFAPSVAGRMRAGQPLRPEAWAHTWQVTVPATTVTYFRAGVSAAGEPLSAPASSAAACVLRRLAPAHTAVLVAYGP